ncbi:hypothetical protein ABHV46_06185 [Asaia sp. BMEF1]|uniref:hypothetical protein n=1 Tax=Asaia sp. BMEF1 TaxID=3155932 RepID=UPI003F67CBAF
MRVPANLSFPDSAKKSRATPGMASLDLVGTGFVKTSQASIGAGKSGAFSAQLNSASAKQKQGTIKAAPTSATTVFSAPDEDHDSFRVLSTSLSVASPTPISGTTQKNATTTSSRDEDADAPSDSATASGMQSSSFVFLSADTMAALLLSASPQEVNPAHASASSEAMQSAVSGEFSRVQAGASVAFWHDESGGLISTPKENGPSSSATISDVLPGNQNATGGRDVLAPSSSITFQSGSEASQAVTVSDPNRGSSPAFFAPNGATITNVALSKGASALSVSSPETDWSALQDPNARDTPLSPETMPAPELSRSPEGRQPALLTDGSSEATQAALPQPATTGDLVRQQATTLRPSGTSAQSTQGSEPSTNAFNDQTIRQRDQTSVTGRDAVGMSMTTASGPDRSPLMTTNSDAGQPPAATQTPDLQKTLVAKGDSMVALESSAPHTPASATQPVQTDASISGNAAPGIAHDTPPQGSGSSAEDEKSGRKLAEKADASSLATSISGQSGFHTLVTNQNTKNTTTASDESGAGNQAHVSQDTSEAQIATVSGISNTLSMTVQTEDNTPVRLVFEGEGGLATRITLQSDDTSTAQHLASNKKDLLTALSAAGIDTSAMKLDIVTTSTNTGDSHKESQPGNSSTGSDFSGTFMGGNSQQNQPGSDTGARPWALDRSSNNSEISALRHRSPSEAITPAGRLNITA